MYELKKIIIITNNPKVYEKYKDQVKIVFEEEYEKILHTSKTMVYNRYELLTHPQASSLKPNQTPYRSIMLYERKESDSKSIMMIEKAIEVFNQWQEIMKTPEDYEGKVAKDFQTIDLSVIENIMPRLM